MPTIKVGYELFDTTVPTGTLSESVLQVNAAYNLAATKFVKKWLAFHDREIKNTLKEMSTQVSGSAIDLLSQATETPIDVKKQRTLNDLTGAVILRPIGLADMSESYTALQTHANLANSYLKSVISNTELYYYNGLSQETDADDTHYLIRLANDYKYMRSHESNDKGKKVTIDVSTDKKEMRLGGETEEDLTKWATVYSLVQGKLYGTQNGLDSQMRQGEKERNVWEEAVVKSNWARDLPERITLNKTSSDFFRRDATMFEAMRLDLVGDDLRKLFASFEANGLTAVDFDSQPFPFEERLHIMDTGMVKTKLTAFSWWVTRCLFDVATPDYTSKYENVASKEIWKKANENRAIVEMEDFDNAHFQSQAKLFGRTDASDETGYIGDTIKEFFNGLKAALESKSQNQLRFSSCKDQLKTEAFPYVLPLIDLSLDNHLVWGSTITPFLLSVIAVASALSTELEEYNGGDSIPIKSWCVSPAVNQTSADQSGYTKVSNEIDIEKFITTISENFKGFYFSNRKALNNGVYAVLFADESSGLDSDSEKTLNQTLTELQAQIETKKNGIELLTIAIDIERANAELRTLIATEESVKKLFAKLQSLFKMPTYNGKQILVNVNGRIPFDIETVEQEKSILKWLYYYIHGFSFPHLETGRKMTGLIEPYCVLIKGPNEHSLATEMQFGNYYYATSIMIALENEACQLLGHIARDNKKRRRGQHYVVADIFSSTRITDFLDLQSKIKTIPNFRHKEFAAALVRLVRAIKSFNDCLNDAGKTTRDRVVMGRIDGERMVTAQEVLYGGWD